MIDIISGTSMNSSVNLKGELSKPRFLGEFDKKNPKSMCMIRPSDVKRMLLLCLQHKKIDIRLNTH